MRLPALFVALLIGLCAGPILADPGAGTVPGGAEAPVGAGAGPVPQPEGVAGAPAVPAPPPPASPELVLLTWADYIDPELVAEFETESGARVRQVHFESDEARDQILAESDRAGFDLLVLENASLDAYAGRGWLAALSPIAIPNRQHIDPRWASAYPESRGLAVPYFWGTVGIVYRRDLTGRELVSWMDLLRPDARLRGHILMPQDSLDLVGVALKALGHSMNSTDPQAIAAAKALLQTQRPAVSRYGTLGLTEDSELVRGDVVAALSYNGDAATLAGFNDRIAYTVPREGGALWVDYLAIAAGSRHPDLAAAFIDFMNRPDVAARNAQHVHYATPNLAAEQLLPAEFRADPQVYPDAATLARCEAYARLPPQALQARLDAAAALMRGD